MLFNKIIVVYNKNEKKHANTKKGLNFYLQKLNTKCIFLSRCNTRFQHFLEFEWIDCKVDKTCVYISSIYMVYTRAAYAIGYSKLT